VSAAAGTTAPDYADGLEHLQDELRHLDLLIRQRVERFRVETGPAPDASGAYPAPGGWISDAEVDGLLVPRAEPDGGGSGLRGEREAWLERMGVRIEASLAAGTDLPLLNLVQVFGLSAFEAQVLILCLAPELDRKYDRIYAYLQDDLARKRPSIDLALELLGRDAAERWRMRTALSGHSPLFRAGLLKPLEDAHSPSGSSGLARFLRVDARIVQYLLGQPGPDDRLSGKLEWLAPSAAPEPSLDPRLLAEVRESVERGLARPGPFSAKQVWNFHGQRGAGKRALAHWVCRQVRCPLLSVDLESLLAEPREEENPFLPVFREGLLLQAAVYLHSPEALGRDEARAVALTKQLSRTITEFGWLTFIGSEEPWGRKPLFDNLDFRSLAVPAPHRTLREAAWEKAMRLAWPDGGEEMRRELARHLSDHFRLTPGRIHSAVMHVRRSQGENAGLPRIERFHEACREQAGRRMGDFATRLEPRYGWEDLVLAPEKIRHLREICDHLRHSQQVFGDWGFEERIAYGRGLSVLFCGPPGTGKTLAAQVIAHELRLELYKVDLSGVVSKYIGETEKNLQRIFREAGGGGAILFFDEADALFGKRTEVSDAHDRYANIETSYLLQKMEEYEGMVILASNLRDNMDEAFTRRIRFIVDFAFPEAADREAIWKAHFPRQAPLEPDVDAAFLARNYPVTGGSIKNIVLNAAFLAAGNGGAIGMKHLLQGAKREYEKIGKLWNDRMSVPAAGGGPLAGIKGLGGSKVARAQGGPGTAERGN
jgi:AAA+ superfamily predicted ATPase